MKRYRKSDFPVEDVRRFLEPGPVVLVSSSYKGERDVFTMGWHLVMEFSPSLIGCYVWDQNYSQHLIRRSQQCVINVPEASMIETVIGIGNCSGEDTDKFAKFKLTTSKATKVEAPLIDQCYASFECKLRDARMVKKYNFFIFEVVKAHVAKSPRFPQTVHYRGDGIFMIAGKNKSYRRLFKPEML